jgi:hypothetical protein
MNNELESIWKEAVMAYFIVIFSDILEVTEENHEVTDTES